MANRLSMLLIGLAKQDVGADKNDVLTPLRNDFDAEARIGLATASHR